MANAANASPAKKNSHAKKNAPASAKKKVNTSTLASTRMTTANAAARRAANVSALSSSFASLPDNVLLYPITTEKAIGMIELENKLLFVVEMRATKPQIKQEVERLFKVKVGSVNTKITPKGVKHAYIRLKEGKADDIATQLKIV